jgi:hypothetical protein
MACPDRGVGEGPIPVNLNHRWAVKAVNRSALKLSWVLTSELERNNIAQILAINPATTEHVHNVVDESGGMTFAGRRYVPDAFQLSPTPGGSVEHPGVVVMIAPVSATEPSIDELHAGGIKNLSLHEHLVPIRDHDVACPGSRLLRAWLHGLPGCLGAN